MSLPYNYFFVIHCPHEGSNGHYLHIRLTVKALNRLSKDPDRSDNAVHT